jgi:hypothetical protein
VKKDEDGADDLTLCLCSAFDTLSKGVAALSVHTFPIHDDFSILVASKEAAEAVKKQKVFASAVQVLDNVLFKGLATAARSPALQDPSKPEFVRHVSKTTSAAISSLVHAPDFMVAYLKKLVDEFANAFDIAAASKQSLDSASTDILKSFADIVCILSDDKMHAELDKKLQPHLRKVHAGLHTYKQLWVHVHRTEECEVAEFCASVVCCCERTVFAAQVGGVNIDNLKMKDLEHISDPMLGELKSAYKNVLDYGKDRAALLLKDHLMYPDKLVEFMDGVLANSSKVVIVSRMCVEFSHPPSCRTSR